MNENMEKKDIKDTKDNKHKKIYVPPRVIGIFKASPQVLAGSPGITTPGEDQGEDGGGMAKPNPTPWASWEDDDLDGNKKPKASKAWEGGDTW